MDIHFDFTKAATRAAISHQVRDLMTQEQWTEVVKIGQQVDMSVEHFHHIGELNAFIDALEVSDEVKADMHGIYGILAQAEAHVHGCAVEETHFHEVGNAPGVLNTLVTCLALRSLEPERITATPVQTGSGQVECAHGVLDIPAPATAAILALGIPTCEEKLEGELCTPTSAAIIKHFVQEFV